MYEVPGERPPIVWLVPQGASPDQPCPVTWDPLSTRKTIIENDIVAAEYPVGSAGSFTIKVPAETDTTVGAAGVGKVGIAAVVNGTDVE